MFSDHCPSLYPEAIARVQSSPAELVLGGIGVLFPEVNIRERLEGA